MLVYGLASIIQVHGQQGVVVYYDLNYLSTLEYHKAKLGGRNGAKLSFKIADKMVFSKVIIEILMMMILMIRKTFLYSGERGAWFWTNAQFLQRSRPNQ